MKTRVIHSNLITGGKSKMGRPKGKIKMIKHTELMRVPSNFKAIVKKITKKSGYPTQTEFLHIEGTKLFENADYLSDITFSLFRKKRRKK